MTGFCRMRRIDCVQRSARVTCCPLLDPFELPFYIGVGGRFWDFGYNCNPNGTVCTDATAFGIRVPFGIDFDFNNVPLDIFLQVVPTLDFFHDYAPHGVGFDFDFSVGARYWFS